jgi:hypothetical protein
MTLSDDAGQGEAQEDRQGVARGGEGNREPSRAVPGQLAAGLLPSDADPVGGVLVGHRGLLSQDLRGSGLNGGAVLSLRSTQRLTLPMRPPPTPMGQAVQMRYLIASMHLDAQ